MFVKQAFFEEKQPIQHQAHPQQMRMRLMRRLTFPRGI